MPIKVPRVRAKPMNNIDEITKLQTTQKWEEPFRQLLYEIYFPGYAKSLAEENPEAYNIEYFYFMALYDEAPHT